MAALCGLPVFYFLCNHGKWFDEDWVPDDNVDQEELNQDADLNKSVAEARQKSKKGKSSAKKNTSSKSKQWKKFNITIESINGRMHS